MSQSDNITKARSKSPSLSSRSLDRGLLRQSPKQEPPKTTPKARLRHDDSQIQFAAIESSPLASEVPDSQILTDRQREVRERQDLEAGLMFPDLRSTPRPRIRERGEVSLKLILKGTQASRTELDTDDSCPMLPPVDEISDDVFGSSPTPRSSRRNSNQRSFNRGPPSSPLGKAQLEAKPSAEPPLPYDRFAQHEVEIEEKRLNVDDSTSEIQTNASAEPMKIANVSDETLQLPLDKSRGTSLETVTLNVPAVGPDSEMTDINPPSDFDIFVDAPSDPLHCTESDVQEQRIEVSTTSPQAQETSMPSSNPISHEIVQEPVTLYVLGNVLESEKGNGIISNEEEGSQIMDSTQGSERSYFPSEDEQIAAQLVSDLERAWSQAEAEMKGDASTIRQSGASKKRKLATGKLGSAKKVKVSPKPQVFQVVVESRKPEDADDYCVFLDGDKQSYVSEDELEEHSPSPPRITRVSTRKSSRSRHLTEPAKSPTASDYSTRKSQASSEEPHLLPIGTEPQLKSTSELPASVDLRLQRQPALSRQSSIESLHAQNSPLGTSQEVDEDPQSAEISRCSNSDAEIMLKSSGIGEIERQLAIERPLDLHASCGETARDKAVVGDGGTISPCQSVEIHDLATKTHKEQTEMEKAASQSRPIGLPSGGDRILLTSRGLDSSRPVRQDLLNATQQVGNAMQQEQEPRAQGILAEFRRLVGEIRQVKLNAEEERVMTGALFECVREVHEAGRRSIDG